MDVGQGDGQMERYRCASKNGCLIIVHLIAYAGNVPNDRDAVSPTGPLLGELRV